MLAKRRDVTASAWPVQGLLGQCALHSADKGFGVCLYPVNPLLTRRRPRTGDTWHLDEVFLRINGGRHDLWRAVDQDDNVLDMLVQSRRNKKAAQKFFRKLRKGLQDVPRVVITDKSLCSAASSSACAHLSNANLSQTTLTEANLRQL
jgi:transposase-like protein